MRLGRRLGSRLVLSFGLLFLLSFSLVVSLTLFFASDWLETAIDDNLRGLSETAAARIGAGSDPAQVVEELSSATQFLEVRDAQGIITDHSSNIETGVIPGFRRPPAADSVLRTTRFERSRLRVITLPLEAPDGGIGGYVVAGSPVPELGDELRTLTFIIAGAGAGGLLIALAGTWYLAQRISRPLTALAQSVRAGAAAGFPAQIGLPADATTEVAELSEAIQDLVDDQQSQLAREREFFADSSHVLRTPLAIVSGNLELLSSAATPAEQDEALRAARGALNLVSRRVDGLLLLARGAVQPRPEWEVVDLSGLLADLVAQLTATAPQLRWSSAIMPNLEMAGDAAQLRELFQSVLENAATYTPAGGEVDVRAAAAGEWNEITVQDSGIGLSEEEARQATTRFFRGHRARRLAPGGSGLGLAIARQIALLHSGSISIRPAPGGRGARVSIRFPRIV